MGRFLKKIKRVIAEVAWFLGGRKSTLIRKRKFLFVVSFQRKQN